MFATIVPDSGDLSTIYYIIITVLIYASSILLAHPKLSIKKLNFVIS